MVIPSIIITLLYLIIILCFIWGFDKIKAFELSDIKAKTKFSVVVPFRNEAKNLPYLLDSLTGLSYPKHLFEVILVDDASDDNSILVIKKVLDTFSQSENALANIKIIKNLRVSNSPKKDAITTAIQQAKHEWIITTDADCIVPKYWLDSFDEYIQKHNSDCIVAPVTYFDGNSFLSRFQLLDILSLQGATIGGFGIKKPFLCNGANFGYTKAAFKAINGFKGNTDIASGDDIFLLEKMIKRYPKSTHYLKCEASIVTTKPQPTWQHLKSQRVRWAAKTKNYNNWMGKLTGIVVILMNFLMLFLPLLSVFGLFNIKIWVYMLIIKLHVDFLLLYKTSVFFDQRKAFRSFLTSFFIYPFFSVYIAVLSLFKGYNWKGRTFKT